MTDVALIESGMDLEKFAIEASQVHGVAKALAGTSFVPTAMRGKPDEVAAAMLFGREIGLSPMVALQSVHVIEGRPSITALAMRGKAQAAGVKFRLIESTQTRCRYAALAPGDGEWTEVLWTIDRAKQLGLTGKQNWLKQPQAMLIARATSELCRLVAAHLFLGYSYSIEELRDGTSEVAGPSAEPPQAEPAPRTVRRAPVKATVSAPQPPPDEQWDDTPTRELPQAAPVEQAGDVSEGGIAMATRKALMAAFNEAGVSERTARLARISTVVGREVHSANQLSESEARTVINDLKGATAGE